MAANIRAQRRSFFIFSKKAKNSSFANLKLPLIGRVHMFLRLILIICLFGGHVAVSPAWAEGYDVERRLLRMDAAGASDIYAALTSQDWELVKDFGVHGYDDGIYWLHLTIRSTVSGQQRLVVRNLYSLHDSVDFYLYKDQTFLQHWPMGDTRKDPGWVFPDKNFAIPLDLEGNTERQVYIRIEGINSKMLKTSVITYIEMQESIHWSRLIFGAIYGIMLVMALYNLIIGFFARDSAYVLYAFQVAFFCFFIMTINGDGRYYLWRDYADFNRYAIQAFGVLYVFFIILFPWYLLKLNRYVPNVKYFFYFLGLVELCFAVSVLTLPYDISMRVAVAVSMLLSPILLGLGLYLMYRKVPIAGIYTFAWSFYLVGATLVGLAAANIVEMNVFTLNGGAVGGIIEQVLLSIALAKRIHIARKEKFFALQHAADSEHEAAHQKRIFQELFERAPVGIVTLSHLGEVTSMNPKCCELFEFENHAQANDSDIPFNKRFSTGKQIRVSTLLKGHITDHETVITTQKNEQKHCTVTLIRQSDYGETVYEGYITDISERKKTQNILLAMEEDRISSLEQLVTGVAHEINTPLGINLTSISFARGELDNIHTKFNAGNITKGALEEYIESSSGAFGLMEKSLKQISTLVSRFKEVSFKHVAPEKQNIKLKKYILFICKEMLADKPEVAFQLDMKSDESLNVYPDLFDIILKQLIENSLVHGFLHTNQGKISLYLCTEHDRIIMEYRDDGPGVDKLLETQIFNPFVTSNRGHADHSGLGLYRIHNLVTQVLKGRIQLLDDTGFAIRIEFDI